MITADVGKVRERCLEVYIKNYFTSSYRASCKSTQKPHCPLAIVYDDWDSFQSFHRFLRAHHANSARKPTSHSCAVISLAAMTRVRKPDRAI